MPPSPATGNVHLMDGSAVDPVRRTVVQAAGGDAGSRSLRRGLALLDAVLDAGPQGVRVVDLCRATGLERGTVHRLLLTLIHSGYVMSSRRFCYVAAPRLAVALQPRGDRNPAVSLQPVLARISAASGDAAFAVVREGTLSACIAREVGSHPVQVLAIQVGTRQPLGVGAAGLALLSALADADVAAVIAGNAPSLAAYGGMTPERMHLLVRATRERGWSVIGNHATRDVLAVGMAVRNRQGECVAAISVASTSARMPRQRQQSIACCIRAALAELLPDGL